MTTVPSGATRATRSMSLILFAVAALVVSAAGILIAARWQRDGAAPVDRPVGLGQSAAESIDELPLGFEPAGRASRAFIARGPGSAVQIDATGADLSYGSHDPVRLRIGLVGADRSARGVAAGQLPGVVNSFVGDRPSRWRTGIRTYRRVRFAGVYPGIGVQWHGNQERLEYDFHLARGADPDRIGLRFTGADSLRVARNGDLVIGAGDRVFREAAPDAFQGGGSHATRVEAAYVIGPNGVSFRLGAYDHSKPLVIDPLVYSTFIGGSANDDPRDMAVDGAGNAYIAGTTTSGNFPGSPVSSPSENLTSGAAYVVKIAPDGALQYASYIGGSGADPLAGIDLAGGRVLLTGNTSSADFPTTANSFQASRNGIADAFVTVLDTTGGNLFYSTYLGGSAANDLGQEAAFGSGGLVFVTGATGSRDYPTAGANAPFDATYNGALDAFVTALDTSLLPASQLRYSTYLGGGGFDEGEGLDFDPGSGDVFVAGRTASNATQFPPTAGAFDTTHAAGGSSGFDAFAARIDPSQGGAGSLVYSTFLGGEGDDEAFGLAVDSGGDAYVAGRTNSPYLGSVGYPTTSGAIKELNTDSPPSGYSEAFLTKVNPAGGNLVYSTLLGGSGADSGGPLVVDSQGDAYVGGLTASTDFPTTSDAVQRSFAGGGNDAWAGRVRPSGAGAADLLYASYFGGPGSDVSSGVGADSAGNVYLSGFTNSGAGLPVRSAFQPAPGGGGNDGYAAKLMPGVPTVVVRPAAVFGVGILAEPTSGQVFVKVPGEKAFRPLSELKFIPVGSIVDARDGFVKITTQQCDGAIEVATFWDGIFQVNQSADLGCLLEAKLVGKLKRGGKPRQNKARTAGSPLAHASATGSRQLWASAKGRFRTRSFRGSATVRGTEWLTTGRCKGKRCITRFRVNTGVLAINDFTKKGAVDKLLKAPGKYTAGK